MGQMTYALAYGIPLEQFQKALKKIDIEQVLSDYGHAKGKKIEALAKKLGSTLPNEVRARYAAVSCVVPDWNVCVVPPFFGFFIAAGASGKDGLPFLGSFKLDDLNKRYRKSVTAAAFAWKQFSDWLSACDMDLPAASVWLIETEVA